LGQQGSTRIRMLRPPGSTERLPGAMYFHGAGWVMGDVNTHDRLVRDIVNGVQAAVVFVDYDRSPEHHYPVAIEEDYAATQYVVEHPHEFNVDAARLAVAGDSVGGNMAAVVSLLAKDRQGPTIRFQLLFCPVADANFDTGSYHEFANGP
jgi:acetyl esterase